MRFSQKMTIAVTLLLAVMISLGGTLLVRRSFQSALDLAISQNTNQHLMEKYAIEAELLGAGDSLEAALQKYAASITGYFTGEPRLFALYSGDRDAVFSNLPSDLTRQQRAEALEADDDSCLIRSTGETSYLLMSSRIDSDHGSARLLSVFDLERIFNQRAEQLRYLWQIEAVLLSLGVVLTSIVSIMLTRNVKKLKNAAHSIARGAYDRRVNLKSKDEIGSLADDFDTMADAVQQNIKSLEASIQSRDDFVAAFSHEMKTPMTALLGYSQLLRRTEEEPAVRRMAADHIYHEARRLETLSQKLLQLMGLSDEEIEPESVSFGEIYSVTLQALYNDKDSIRLELKGDSTALLEADKSLCADLLCNLVTNALRASDNEPVRIHVRMGRQKCRMTVYDSGHGIPSNEIARVTEAFYMVDKSRSHSQGGSGVGLALAQKIAMLHGSSLRFRSEIGKGTAVSFSLLRSRDGGIV